MYVYTYIYMYVYMYIFLHVCVYINVCVYVCLYSIYYTLNIYNFENTLSNLKILFAIASLYNMLSIIYFKIL